MQKYSIIVFGGAGRTGSEVVKLALEQGYTVSAFVYHNPPARILPDSPQLKIIEGNARDYQQVKAALTGHDVVINIIAPKIGDKKNYDISVVASQNIVKGMQELGIKRYIGQAGAWATEYIEDASLLMQIGFKVFWPLRQIYSFKKNEDRIVKDTPLNWTLVRCGILSNGKLAPVKTHMPRYKCGLLEIPHISRKSVAQFHLDILDNPEYYKQTPVIFS